MAVTVKSEKQIALMREAGRLLAITHEELHKHHKEHYDDHAGIHSREMWEDMI